MIKTINILGFEDKTSKNDKPYTSFQTSEGNMNCFETDLIKVYKVASVQGEEVKANVIESEDGKFKNLRKLNEISNETRTFTPQAKPVTKSNTTMYVSYAKDIFNKILQTNSDTAKETELTIAMNQAIKLVKQAKEEFQE